MAPSAKGASNAAGGSSNSNNAASLGIGLSSSSAGGAGGGIGLGSLAGVPASVYPTDTIRDVAESVGINGMKESVAAALAADVEYRIREIVQDATKYMRHSKRDQLKTTDIDAALRARNIEPIYGFLPSSSGRSGASNPSRYTAGPTFRRVQTASGVPLHYVEDEEIDFDKILEAGPKIGIGRGVGWGAHWLAIEGVQPAVPQNPSPIAIAEAKGGSGFMGPTSTQPAAAAPAAKAVTVAGGDGQAIAKPLVKHILSRELQLYYERLTKSIVSPPPEADEDLDDDEIEEPAPAFAPAPLGSTAQDQDDAMDPAGSPKDQIVTPPRPTISLAKPLKTFAQKGSGNHVRDAALASLRGDPGLHQLVPYLIQFVGSKVIEILRSPSSDDSAAEADGSSTATAVRESRQISAADNHMLSVLLSTIHAILVNPHIFIELYLHQMMPSILSILLTSSLAEPELLRQLQGSDDVHTPLVTAGPSSYALRAHASALLTHVVDTFGSSYPTLKPRVVATLLKALMTGVVPGSSDQDSAAARRHEAAAREPRASPGTKLGALMALRRLGKASFRTLLSSSAQLNARLGDSAEPTDATAASSASPLRLLGEWMHSWESGSLHTGEGGQPQQQQQAVQLRALQMKPIVNEVASALHALLPPFVAPNAELSGTAEERDETLTSTYGGYWMQRVIRVDGRARAALETELGMRSSSSSGANGAAKAVDAAAKHEQP
ncbi:related to TAF6-Subunit (60 kDa) of TFIID and SAGA complexes [Sporisorium reilianum f. sp. reilianum]|uniref:TBP-associated factor 6 n=1 Tax=Sporisorium reilianum f. sp. reilianum TaxID=72559 RepID=A0A2N8UH09_9BASI|nr:related to TAF6-Subunit (60 kDa) of TFIID and SAGA complexes [Sporisorium reilianum f. sp. reilianum]